MPNGPAVFAWIWLNREHESFMNCASVQIGVRSGNSTTSIALSSTTCPAAPSAPTDGILGEEEHGFATRNGASIARDNGSSSKLTRSHWGHIYYRHSRKHHRYYYYVRKAHRHQSSRQNHQILETSAACDWDFAPRMETSYFSTDANCAPNAKLNNLRSDNFEIGWGNACAIIEGDNEYPIRAIEC